MDACFFCLGVSSIGMSESEYHHLTYDLTLAAATALASVTAPRLTFCYVSGEGTDSTEHGRTAWARTKGMLSDRFIPSCVCCCRGKRRQPQVSAAR